MRKHGVAVEVLRAVDHDIATGVYPDMTEHGWETDEWPEIYERVAASDILVIAGPIWLGDNASVTRRSSSGSTPTPASSTRPASTPSTARSAGPSSRERGRRQALLDEHPLQPAAHRLHDPAQADAGWIGEVGPGPSYLDEGSGGPENDFTNRNTTFMTWNLMHLARMLKDRGGIPAHGNQRSAWDEGERFDFEQVHGT